MKWSLGRGLALFGAGLLGLSCAVPSATAAPTGGERYVALGDSYASGAGARTYYPDSGGCNRSPMAYAPVLANRFGFDLDFVACLAATTRSVLSQQISHLKADTRYVTISVGGNDAGFTKVITQCAKPWPTTCWGDLDAAEKFIRTDLRGRLDEVYDQIRSRAPRARVVVVGNPRLFMHRTCNLGTRISVGEQDRLNQVADALAENIRYRAQAAGFTFVDVREKFTGHAVCADEEWINGLSKPIEDSFHPNERGYRALTELVGAVLR